MKSQIDRISADHHLNKQDKLFAQEIESSCLSERTDSFQYAFPEFYYFDLKLERNILIYNKLVVKLRFCVDADNWSNACLILTGSDKSKIVRTIRPEKALHFIEVMRNPQNTMYYSKVKLTQTFLGDKGVMDWAKTSVKIMYAKPHKNTRGEIHSPTDFYSQLHKEIKQELLTRIDLLKITKVNIIDGGCGDGLLLKLISPELQTKGIQAQCLGFDFNQANIDDCLSGYRGKVRFKKGNLLQINEIIQSALDEKIFDKSAPTIVLLSGSLTRLVLPSLFQAIEILQKLAFSDVSVISIIGGGLLPVLFNSFILKRIGFFNLTDTEFFSLRRLSSEEILQNKINKIKRGFLDLSMSPQPSLMLLTLKQYFTDNLIVDLSFCYFSEELLETITNILQSFNNITFIFWHHNPEHLKKMVEAFGHYDGFITQLVTQEAHAMAPRSFFHALQPGALGTSLQCVEKHQSYAKFIPFDVTKNAHIFKRYHHYFDNGMINLELINQFILLQAGCAHIKGEARVKAKIETMTVKYNKQNTQFTMHLQNRNGKQIKTLINSNLEKDLSDYFSDLESRKDQNEVFPELLYIYQQGLSTVRIELDGAQKSKVKTIIAGRDVEQELDFYRSLGMDARGIFPSHLMTRIVTWRSAQVAKPNAQLEINNPEPNAKPRINNRRCTFFKTATLAISAAAIAGAYMGFCNL